MKCSYIRALTRRLAAMIDSVRLRKRHSTGLRPIFQRWDSERMNIALSTTA